MIRLTLVLIAAVSVAAGVGWLGEAGYPPLLIVHEGEQVVVRGPGERVKVYDSPGKFAFRVPFLSESRVFDTRLRVSKATAVPLAGGDDSVDVQLWWRIADAQRFASAWPETQEPGSTLAAQWIEPFSRALATTDLDAVLVGGSSSLETLLLGVAREGLRADGIELRSVRLAEPHGTGLLQAMRAEREASRTGLRREVAEVASRLSADARREAAQLESGAERDAEITRGRAEAEAARIYADAHSEAPEFYAFSRRLEAYRNTLGPNTTLVLPPDHDFFRFLSPASEAGP